ncbi:MAG TPA: hypothetical protein VGI74_08680 [Streptosporangiaceae bacterium]
MAVASCGASGGAPAAGSAGNGNDVTYGAPTTYSAPTQSSAPAEPSSPTSAPPPFPEVGPVARTAGTTSLTSEHWVGYTFPASNVTGVRAEWTEPSVQGGKNSEEFVWIGVGGWNQTDDNIVQDGTFVYYPPDGGRNEGVWYEQVPPINGQAKFPGGFVSPGDHIYASVIHLARADQWQVAVDDVTDGSNFAINLHFRSMEAYPSFVVEDPDNGPAGPTGPFFPFPRWGTVTISNMQVRVGSSWVPAATLPAYQINMVRRGRVMAQAGPLSTRSSFAARQR